MRLGSERPRQILDDITNELADLLPLARQVMDRGDEVRWSDERIQSSTLGVSSFTVKCFFEMKRQAEETRLYYRLPKVDLDSLLLNRVRLSDDAESYPTRD